jgi:multidrug resistance protein
MIEEKDLEEQPRPLECESDTNHSEDQNSPATVDVPLDSEHVQSVPVPRNQRRGLLARFTLIEEQENAYGYTPKVKAFITCIISLAAVIAPMGASILLPALDNVGADLHVGIGVVNVSFGLYLLSLGIFPLWWSGLSEANGRRTVYVISFTLYTLFCIGSALSKNIASLMVCRILSGGAAASVQAVGAGTIGDIYVTTQRGRAMGYFYLGPLCGPLLAPIIGGAITAKWGWRGTQWFCVILGGVMTVFITFGLPETLKRSSPLMVPHDEDDHVADPLAPAPSRTSRISMMEKHHHPHFDAFRRQLHIGSNDFQSSHPQNKTVKQMLVQTFVHPLRSFRFLRFPPVPLAMVYSSFCFCALYFLNIGIQALYVKSPYNFSSILVGLLYIPNSIGYMVSSIANGYWSDRIIARSIRKHGHVVPEARLSENVFLAAVLFPCALLIFGWAGHAKTFWLVPLIGTFIFGVASMLIFGNIMTYLVDALPGRGSSGVALNNLFRMVLAAVATFVAEPLQNAIGYGWLYTILAIGSVLAFGSILAIKKWGAHWRESFDVTTLY